MRESNEGRHRGFANARSVARNIQVARALVLYSRFFSTNTLHLPCYSYARDAQTPQDAPPICTRMPLPTTSLARAVLGLIFVVCLLFCVGIALKWYAPRPRASTAVAEAFRTSTVAHARCNPYPRGRPMGTYSKGTQRASVVSSARGPARTCGAPPAPPPPTEFTSAVESDVSYDQNCLSEAYKSRITQVHPLPEGSKVRVRFSTTFLKAAYKAVPNHSLKQGTYYDALVIRYIAKGDGVYDNDNPAFGAGTWQSGSGKFYTINDIYSRRAPYLAKTPANMLKLQANVYPGIDGPSPVIIHSYPKASLAGYLVTFIDPNIDAIYHRVTDAPPNALFASNPLMLRLIPEADVLILPIPETVDACAKACLQSSNGNVRYIQVGNCQVASDADGKTSGCTCMCVPVVTDDSDACARSPVSTPNPPPAKAYHVYTIDPNAAIQKDLLAQFTAQADAGLRRNVGAYCAKEPSALASDENDCGCVSACTVMNAHSSQASQHCLNTAEIDAILTSLPRATTLGVDPPPIKCGASGSASATCPESTRACRFYVEKDACDAQTPRCKWTTDAYEYSTTGDADTGDADSDDAMCSRSRETSYANKTPVGKCVNTSAEALAIASTRMHVLPERTSSVHTRPLFQHT